MKATVQTADGPKTVTLPDGLTANQVNEEIGGLFEKGVLRSVTGPRERAVANRLSPTTTATERSDPMGDFYRAEVPPLAAMAATAPMTGGAPLLVRAGAGAMAAGVASRALGASPEEAGGQAAIGAGGEVAGAALHGVFRGGRGVIRTLTQKAAASKAGQDAVNAAAREVVESTVSALDGNATPEMATSVAKGAFETFDSIFRAKALQMRLGVIGSVADDPKLLVAIPDIAKRVGAAIKESEIAKGFLSPVGQFETDALKMVRGARGAEGAMSEAERRLRPKMTSAENGMVRDPIQESVGVAYADPNAGDVKAILSALTKNSEHVAALINIRGQVSQMLARRDIDEGTRRVLMAIDTKALDKKILATLDQKVGPDAAQAYKSYLDFYSKHADMAKESFFRAAQAHPEKIADFVEPNAPHVIDIARAVARETASATLIPNLQKQFLRQVVDEKGLAGLRTALGEYGGETVGKLFAEPKAAQAVASLLKASDLFADKFGAPGVASSIARDRIAALLGRATIGAVAGGAAGYSSGHNTLATTLGALSGGAALAFGQRALVNMALKDPGVFRAFVGQTEKFLERGGDVPLKLLARRLAGYAVTEETTPQKGALSPPDPSSPASMSRYSGAGQ